MCNAYEQHITWAAYRKVMQQLELGIPTHQFELDLPKADDIRIHDVGPVMRAAGNVVELVPMTFGFAPSSPRADPVFNFKSEGRRFDKQPLPDPGDRLLRVHRPALSEGQASLLAQGRPVHGDRRALARSRGRWNAGICHAYDRARSRREALPRSAGRGVAASGLGQVALSQQARG
jgi:hypothetical protein